ncbi:Beta-1,3-N-Acetylglucosaminyltransferase family protein [Parasponia andersonii]|uniref:Beta-1,3-N-Acetylglucosaminyltransferase family protein n=1 Tax=Parasponia andersonii TaxID=3476 RepID=A0A2P5DDF4_PARAD|nr:Beta-1,3-N-Acetylglucosaminyltransferase family protein [Parasponia andersonii]
MGAGNCGNCSLNNINIGTVRSGREIGGKSEWNVTVINNCGCPQKQIKLGCKGFQTVEPVDPATFFILDGGDGQCLLVNGSTLEGFASVGFSYAWDPPFLLLPLYSVIAPSC